MQETPAYATAIMLLHTTGNLHHVHPHYIWPYRLRLFLLIMERSKNLQTIFQRSGCHRTITTPDQTGTVGGTQDIAVAGMQQIAGRRVFFFIFDDNSFIFIGFGALKLAPLRLFPAPQVGFISVKLGSSVRSRTKVRFLDSLCGLRWERHVQKTIHPINLRRLSYNNIPLTDSKLWEYGMR